MAIHKKLCQASNKMAQGLLYALHSSVSWQLALFHSLQKLNTTFRLSTKNTREERMAACKEKVGTNKGRKRPVGKKKDRIGKRREIC